MNATLTQNVSLKSFEKDIENSIERFDDFDDSTYKDYIQAREELDYIDTFENVLNSNMNSKLNMLKKINDNYGACNRGIENYCRIQSLEAETEGTSAIANDTKDSNKPADNPNTDKKEKWYQIVWNKIKEFFSAIGRFFKKIWDKIVGLFKKTKDTDEAIDNADGKQEKQLEEYLNSVELPTEDKNDEVKGYVSINDKLPENLSKSADRYIQICTQFNNAITDLTNKKEPNSDSIKKFIEMAKIYLDDDKNISNSGNDSKILLNVLNKLASKKYDRLKDSGKFGSKIVDSNKIPSIVGTSNPKKVKNVLKSIADSISKFNKSMDQGEKLCNEATKKFNSYLKKREDKNDENNKIAIALFKALTKVADINRGFTKDVAITIKDVKHFGLVNGVKKVFGDVKEFIKKFFVRISSFVRNTLQKFDDTTLNAYVAICNKYDQIANGVISGIKSAGNGIRNVASSAGNGIRNAASSAGNGIRNAASDVAFYAGYAIFSAKEAMKNIVSEIARIAGKFIPKEENTKFVAQTLCDRCYAPSIEAAKEFVAKYAGSIFDAMQREYEKMKNSNIRTVNNQKMIAAVRDLTVINEKRKHNLFKDGFFNKDDAEDVDFNVK